MTHVCVYAICKNEAKNVYKWTKSLYDSDLVVVLDTGSTDDTIECFERIYTTHKNIKIFKASYDKFDFSVARNDALLQAKSTIKNEFSDTDLSDWVFVSLDLDETLDNKGIGLIRDNWDKSADTMCLKSIIENGSSMIVNYKIHNSTFYWYRTVHEIIKNDNKKESEWNTLRAVTYYHHNQDLSKPRNYYDLLKLDHEKRHNDTKTLIYLCWEAYLHEDYEEMHQYAIECLSKLTNESNKDDENYNDPQYIAQAYIYIALFSRIKEDYKDEAYYYEFVINMINTGKMFDFRSIHYMLAEAYWKIDKQLESAKQYEALLNVQNVPSCWIEDMKMYGHDQDYELNASVAYYYAGKYYDSLYYAEKLYRENPDNELYKSNLDSIRNGFENYIKNK